MTWLSEDFRGHLRMFAFWLGNGTLLAEDRDYTDLFENPSALEMTFAIWSNNLDLDDAGRVINGDTAHRRAAEYVRWFVDPDYVVAPPFEEWETELY